MPFETLIPASNPAKLHFFCIGLRDIEETVDGTETSNCTVSFKVSGSPLEEKTDVTKVKLGGMNINRLINIELDAPNNQNFCPVMDVFTWEETPGKPRKLLGTTTI